MKVDSKLRYFEELAADLPKHPKKRLNAVFLLFHAEDTEVCVDEEMCLKMAAISGGSLM